MLPRAHWQLGSELEIENAFSNSATLPRIVVHRDLRSRRRAFCDGPARQMSRSHSIPLPPPLLPFRPAPERFAVRGSRHRIDPVPELRRAIILLTDSATRASAFRQPRIRGDLASVRPSLLPLQKPFPCDVASLGRSSASVKNSHHSASGKGDFSSTSPSNVESRRRKNYPRGRVSSFASVGETPSRACEVDTGGGLTKYSDFLVVGSGIAGLRYALAVAEHGTVNVVTKSEPHESNTQYAQGGVSAVLDPLDSVESHIRDTIVAGAFLCDEETVEVVCREGPERVRELMEIGVLFDHSEDGQLHLAREGGHSHHRIVHAADMTGREIERALLAAVVRNPNIKVFEHHCAVDLLTLQDGATVTCYGVDALDIRCNQVVRFLGGVTLLASGGSGHIYPSTTNPLVSTGDGVALANRAHAVVSNMEFVQFHPTALADEGLPIRPPPRENAFLITEAVRGDGGLLYNQAKERFMHEYDPREELAPRDVVARSIDDQLKKRNEKYVYLDISHKPAEAILAHFPNIAAECMKYGLDITKDPIPVVPAAHYMCGGIQTGLLGETSIMGLYAAGEVTCTGLHGANRLASNSLLEALVFAQRAVEPSVGYVRYMAGMQFNIDEASEWPRLSPCSPDDANMEKIADFTRVQRKKLQQTMWEYVGIVRSTDRLKIAQTLLNEIQVEWEEFLYRHGWNPSMVGLELCEMRNLITVANLVVSSAMVRQESRGLHFTVDFPELVESERQATMLFPSTPMNTTWSSQQVHTMSLKSMPLPVPDPALPIHPQKKIDR